MVSEQSANTGDFQDRVWSIVAAIPTGSVTTYGDIARAAGSPRDARRVGWVLHRVPEELDLACHRVVNREGRLTGGWAFGHPAHMRAMLEAEGIAFLADDQVDLDRHRWQPDPFDPPPTK
jgi:methylated-DNA-protein-cysteine methyltransferase related protein